MTVYCAECRRAVRSCTCGATATPAPPERTETPMPTTRRFSELFRLAQQLADTTPGLTIQRQNLHQYGMQQAELILSTTDARQWVQVLATRPCGCGCNPGRTRAGAWSHALFTPTPDGARRRPIGSAALTMRELAAELAAVAAHTTPSEV